MKSGGASLWLMTIAACAAALVLTGRNAAGAHRRAAEQRESLLACRAAAAEVLSLRAELPGWATTDRRSDGGSLAARLAAVLAGLGLPASSLSSVSPQPPALAAPDAAGQRQVRERAGIVLGGVTLAQLGSFLVAWREQHPEWCVVGMDLAPLERASGPPTTSPRSPPIRAVLMLECVYAQQQGGVR